MKIRADRAELADAVSWVAQAISKRPAHIALSGMRLKAEDDTLTLYAFDYDVSHQAAVDVEVQNDGEVLVAGNFLREVLGAMKGKEVELVLDGPVLQIQSGRSSYTAQVYKADEYPKLPPFPPEQGRIAGADLADMIAATKHAHSDVDAASTAGLRGLHIDGHVAELTVVGFSRFAGSVVSSLWSNQKHEFKCQVPVKAIETAVKGLGAGVRIGYQEGLLGLDDGTRQVTMRTYEDEFAAYRRAMRDEKSDKTTITVDVAELLGALKRISLLNREGAARLEISEGRCEVSLATDGFAGTEQVDVELDGAPLTVTFSIELLSEALHAIPSGAVQIGLVDHAKVGMLRPLDHPRMALAVMPRRGLS